MRKNHTKYTLGLIGAALTAGTAASTAQNEGLLGGLMDGVSGEISSGYDSEYFYRGLWFGGDNVWTGIDLSKELCENVSASVGVYYLDTVNPGPNYSESGLSATLSWDSGMGTIDAGFTFFRFYNGFDGDGIGQNDASEFAITYSTDDFYGFSGYVQAVWDGRIDAFYYEAGLAQSVDFGFASLDLSASVGYSNGDYYTAGDTDDGFTHALLSAALPIQLTENVTFTPHVSVNISMEARDGSNDGLGQDQTAVFGGAAISVAF